MKYLSNSMEKKRTELFKRTCAFYAFTRQQFVEGKLRNNLDKDVVLVTLREYFYVPRKYVEELREGLEEIEKERIREDLKENSIETIIKREMYNYGQFWEYNIDELHEKLKDYRDITRKKIRKVFTKEVENFYKKLN